MKVAGASPPMAWSRCWTAPDAGLISSSTTRKKLNLMKLSCQGTNTDTGRHVLLLLSLGSTT